MAIVRVDDPENIIEIKTLTDKQEGYQSIVGKHPTLKKVCMCIHCGRWFGRCVYPSRFCSERCYEVEHYNRAFVRGYKNPYVIK